jgi:hypothetical protein
MILIHRKPLKQLLIRGNFYKTTFKGLRFWWREWWWLNSINRSNIGLKWCIRILLACKDITVYTRTACNFESPNKLLFNYWSFVLNCCNTMCNCYWNKNIKLTLLFLISLGRRFPQITPWDIFNYVKLSYSLRKNCLELNVNPCVNLCKQSGVLATLFRAKNVYIFAFAIPPFHPFWKISLRKSYVHNKMHNTFCYIARVNTKRDWLICGHVTSDKCNVSRRATSEKLWPAPTGYTYINKQNGGPTSTSRNYDFPSLSSNNWNKECKREEKYTTGNRICRWNRLSRFF